MYVPGWGVRWMTCCCPLANVTRRRDMTRMDVILPTRSCSSTRHETTVILFRQAIGAVPCMHKPTEHKNTQDSFST
jgi:hypothetical protein